MEDCQIDIIKCNCLMCSNLFYVENTGKSLPSFCPFCGRELKEVVWEVSPSFTNNDGTLFRDIKYPPPQLPYDTSDLPDNVSFYVE